MGMRVRAMSGADRRSRELSIDLRGESELMDK